MTTSSDIRARLADPGFTPGVKTLGALLDLVGGDDEDEAKLATRAVLRIEQQYSERVADKVIAGARAAARPARGRLTQLVGRLVAETRDPKGSGHSFLVEALADEDPKTRRSAARALGNLAHTPAVVAALKAAFERSTNEDDKKAFGLALGKAGVAMGQTGRAGLIVERETARRAPGAIDLNRAPAAPLRFFYKTRSGLEEIVKREVGRGARFFAPGIVETTLSGSLESALVVRTASEVAFPLADRETKDLPNDVADALASEDALTIFRTFSTGTPIRFRLAIAKSGHQRSLVWSIAEAMRSRTKELVNDPKDSTWEVGVDVAGSRLRIELVPRGFVDPRFTYRQDVVPASSHPTIAAALARLAPRSENDVVWDPFAGAGAELIERAKLGPYARLFGTDLEKAAVDAARANAKRAGVDRILIERGDALDPLVPPDGVTTIITNPPMGRRVHRGTHAELLERFVDRAAEVLVPGGALVWVVPDPARLRARAEAAGLLIEHGSSLDMSGFSAELSIYVKPGVSSRARKRR